MNNNNNNNKEQEYENDGSEQFEWEENEFNQHRPVAQFGFRYDYHNVIVDTSTKTPPIPDIVRRLLLDPVRSSTISATSSSDTAGTAAAATTIPLSNDDVDVDVHVADVEFTQCIINDYRNANTVIPWHKDDKAFGKVVLVYTFLDERPLCLRTTKSTLNGDDENRRDEDENHSGKDDDDDDDDDDDGDDGANNKDVIFYTAYPRHCSRYILKSEARESWEHSVPEGKGRRVSFTFRTLRSDDEAAD